MPKNPHGGVFINGDLWQNFQPSWWYQSLTGRSQRAQPSLVIKIIEIPDKEYYYASLLPCSPLQRIILTSVLQLNSSHCVSVVSAWLQLFSWRGNSNGAPSFLRHLMGRLSFHIPVSWIYSVLKISFRPKLRLLMLFFKNDFSFSHVYVSREASGCSGCPHFPLSTCPCRSHSLLSCCHLGVQVFLGCAGAVHVTYIFPPLP